jgi:hypothetical protein
VKRRSSRLWIFAAILLGAGLLTGESCAADADTAGLARMTPGYTYFNRPGASMEDHARDVVACARLAGAVRSMAAIWAGDTLSSPVSFGPVGQGTERALAMASLENCMVVRGWRVAKLPELEGRELAALAPADLLQKLSPWIGADAPHGEIVRRWDNDAARRSAHRFGQGPRTKDGQLSLLAAAPELRRLPPPNLREPPSPWKDPRWPQKPIEAAALTNVRPDAGVVLIEIKGDGIRAGWGLVFNRVGSDSDTWPSATDHAPDKLEVVRLGVFRHGIEAYALPPGRWRIYGLGVGPTLNLCLGSPSFELAAGEVTYAGAFDLSAEDITPDMDLAPARAWLGDAKRPVTAAAYANGSLGPCGDNSIYALEFKNAPFEPGYVWGSQAARR